MTLLHSFIRLFRGYFNPFSGADTNKHPQQNECRNEFRNVKDDILVIKEQGKRVGEISK
jgi:hypothetical protein